MPYLLVVNPESGSDARGLAARAANELDDAGTVELAGDADLGDAVRTATSEGRVVVACGGDGTVNAVAQHLAGTDGVLGILPGGTMNHFARDLGVGDPDDALRALARGRPVRVDVGRADGRAFVNNLSIGLYADLVRERERHEDRLGRWRAVALAAVRVAREFEPFRAVLTADGDAREATAAVVFVANNRVSRLGRRERLDAGVLDVRVLRVRPGIRGRASLTWGVARGVVPGRGVARTEAREARVRLPRGDQPVAVDGEHLQGTAALDARIEQGALRVLVP